MFISSCRRNSILRKLTRLCFFCNNYSTLKLQVKLCEVPDVCKSEEWGCVIQETRAVLQTGAALRPHINLATKVPSTGKVIRRLQETSQNNNHLIETFKQLLSNTEVNATEIRWPGLLTLMLSTGIGSPFRGDDFVSKALEDVVWSSQVTLAEVVNLLYCKLLFQKENRRLNWSTNRRKSSAEVDRLVDSYFTSSVLRMISTLRNDKVLFLFAKALESFSERKSSEVASHPLLIRNLKDWQHNALHPQGLLLAAGCQSTLELAGLDERTQEMAFQFGECFSLAIKANGDIQQFWNYQRSYSSIINISSFPVALHLENHPETLEYLYSCSDMMDNLNYNTLNSILMTNAAIEEAKHQLSKYVQKAIHILQDFPQLKSVEVIELLLKLIKTLENIDKN